jgi:hypothetical protein
MPFKPEIGFAAGKSACKCYWIFLEEVMAMLVQKLEKLIIY